MGNSNQNRAITILEHVQHTGSIVLHGVTALETLRDAIELAIRQSGITVTFDPDSEPELVDYLTVGGVSALETAFPGALIGLVLGALVGRPGLGLVIGGAGGAVVGAARGVRRVRDGWRVRAVRAADGSPFLLVSKS